MVDKAMDVDQGSDSQDGTESHHHNSELERGLGDKKDHKNETEIKNPFDLFVDLFTQEVNSYSGPRHSEAEVREFARLVWTRLPMDQRFIFIRATVGLNRQNLKMGENFMDEDHENNSQDAHKHDMEATDPFSIFLEYITEEMKKQGMHQQLDKVEVREIAAQMWSEMLELEKRPYIDAARSKDIEMRKLGRGKQEMVRKEQEKEKERKQNEAKKKAKERKKDKKHEEVPSPCKKTKKVGKVVHSQSDDKLDKKTRASSKCLSKSAGKESRSDSASSKNEDGGPKKKSAKSTPKKPNGKNNDKPEKGRKASSKCSTKSAGKESRSDSECSNSQHEEPRKKNAKTTPKKPEGKKNGNPEEKRKTKSQGSSDEDSDSSSKGPSPIKKRQVGKVQRKSSAKPVSKKRAPAKKILKRSKSAPSKIKKIVTFLCD